MKFQFHKGTIRTTGLTSNLLGGILFQFHKGTIRTFLMFAVISVHGYFNSIKVRLERVLNFALSLKNQFQFHKGTIRTLQSLTSVPA